MRPIVVTVGPLAASNAANIVASTTPVSGTPLTIVGGSPFVMDTPRRVLLTFGIEASTRTLVIVGTDRSGQTRTETLTVPSGGAGTAISALDYATVVSLTPLGGGWSAAASVGTSSTTTSASSAWVRLDDYGFQATQIAVVVTGTINFTVEGSDDDPNAWTPNGADRASPFVQPQNMTWICPDTTNLSSKTANLVYELGVTNTGPRPVWIRLTCNSYTNPGAATMTVHQPGGRLG